MGFRIFLVVLLSALYSCDGSTFRASKGKKITKTAEVGPVIETAEFNSSVAYVSEDLPADFLFVVDNSISMTTYYQRVKDSILKIPLAKYPKNSKIAVMSGMVAEFPDQANPSVQDYRKPHSFINRGLSSNPNYYFNIELEPGFLDFTSKASIEKFKNSFSSKPVGNTLVDKYTLTGCDDKWFSPDQTSADGTPCISAALQSTFYGVGCEANIVAFQQLLEKNKGKSLFRSGAFLHVIFVSDEVHPGCGLGPVGAVDRNMKNDIFNDVCLAFDKVEEAVKANSDVYGVKFHGIVESPANDLKYKSASKSCGYVNQLITPSKGIALDITDNKTVDYSPMIESVIKTTAVSVPELLYQLPATAKVIKSIVIDGEEFKGDYTFDKDGTLRIRGVSQDVERKIIVNFEG